MVYYFDMIIDHASLMMTEWLLMIPDDEEQFNKLMANSEKER